MLSSPSVITPVDLSGLPAGPCLKFLSGRIMWYKVACARALRLISQTNRQATRFDGVRYNL